MKLIDRWDREVLRLWSMRVALIWTVFWSAIGGLILIWDNLSDYMPKWAFIGLGILMPVSLGLARLLKQPGADDE